MAGQPAQAQRTPGTSLRSQIRRLAMYILFNMVVFSLLMNQDSHAFLATLLTLLVGTPLLSFIGAIGAGLTVSLQKGGILVSLLVLPLFIPVLIFATSAIDISSMSSSYSGQLAILGAMLALASVSAPIAISSALKVSVS